MDVALILIFVLVVAAAAIGFAFWAARRVREAVADKAEAKAEDGFSWLGHFHSVWWIIGAAAGALKYVYRAWKVAPAGSAERVGWGALLALVTAFGLFVLIKVIDRRLNPPQEVDGGLARDEGREQTTAYTQLTRE